jgi:hypothetical protein
MIPYNITDNYYLFDFQNEFSGIIFDNKEIATNTLRKNLVRIVRKITGTRKIFLKLTPNQPFYELNLKDLDKYEVFDKYQYYVEKKDSTGRIKRKLKTGHLYEDTYMNANFYRSMEEVWEPYHLDLPPTYPISEKFNTFEGFKAKLVPYDMDIIKPILNHIFEVWACEDMEHFKYILTLLAFPIRNLTRSEIALVLLSSQGAGKTSILIGLLMSYIYGDKIATATEGLQAITKTFNSMISKKLALFVNEVEAGEGQSFQQALSTFNTFKAYITDQKISCERKYKDREVIDNYCSFFLCTQHRTAIHLEGDDDRRFAIFECSAKYKNNFTYFKELFKHINQNTGNHLYSFFRSDEFASNYMVSDVRKIPITPIKREVMKLMNPSQKNFFDELIDLTDTLEIPIDLLYLSGRPNNRTWFIPSSLFYKEVFLPWHKEKGYTLPKKESAIITEAKKTDVFIHLNDARVVYQYIAPQDPHRHRGFTINPNYWSRIKINYPFNPAQDQWARNIMSDPNYIGYLTLNDIPL